MESIWTISIIIVIFWEIILSTFYKDSSMRSRATFMSLIFSKLPPLSGWYNVVSFLYRFIIIALLWVKGRENPSVLYARSIASVLSVLKYLSRSVKDKSNAFISRSDQDKFPPHQLRIAWTIETLSTTRLLPFHNEIS